MSFSVPIPSVPVFDTRGLDMSRGRDESAVDDDELPTLAPTVSTHSQRATSIIRHGGAGIVSHRHHHPEDRTDAESVVSRRDNGPLSKPPSYETVSEATITRRTSASRPSFVRSSVERREGGVDDKGSLSGSIGPDAELGDHRGSFTYPPNASASATVTDLPRLSFLQSSSTPELSNAQRKKYRQREWLYFAAVTWSMCLNGWNDGTVGPLMPVIQRDYRIGFATAALLFVFNCLGFILGAVLNMWLNARVGFGKMLVTGALIQTVSYAVQAPQPPFPVMVFGFALAGLGMSFQNAQSNGYVGSNKDHQAVKLNLLHAAYGLGAFASPLSATYFSGTRRWSFQYLLSACFALSNLIFLALVFRGRHQEVLLRNAGQLRPPTAGADVGSQGRASQNNVIKEILTIRAVHFMALFLMIYIGVEVTVGGWIVTFIVHERNGGPDAGYISSGFFAGLTLGRLMLIGVNRMIGEHRAIFVYTALCIALELTVWFVPNIFQNAVAVAVIGLLLGPMFPLIVGHATRVFPHRVLTGTIGWITGIGMSGSAMLPFITGVLAGKYGIGSLQPFLVAMMATMIGCWALVPKSRRHVD